jgi:hypothetical protein
VRAVLIQYGRDAQKEVYIMQAPYLMEKRGEPPGIVLLPAKARRGGERNRLCRPRRKQGRTESIVERATRLGAWGVSASFDIYNCEPAKIRSADKIREFVVELCDLIDMKRFGETTVVHFGEDERVAGFSMS